MRSRAICSGHGRRSVFALLGNWREEVGGTQTDDAAATMFPGANGFEAQWGAL